MSNINVINGILYSFGIYFNSITLQTKTFKMYQQYFSICRIITVIVLVILFALNSYVIFKHFIEGKTVVSSSISINEKGVQTLPAIIICRERAYNERTEMFKLSDYFSNTLFLDYEIEDDNLKIIAQNSTLLKHEEIYSFNRGRCIVLKYLKAVRLFFRNSRLI